jgi:hypothetical protein
MNAHGMTSDDMARYRAVKNDPGVVSAGNKVSRFSGLGSSLAGVGSMGLMMGGSIAG